MDYCVNCGKRINEGTKFCPSCGFDLNNKKASVLEKVRFCSKCGYKLNGEDRCPECGTIVHKIGVITEDDNFDIFSDSSEESLFDFSALEHDALSHFINFHGAKIEGNVLVGLLEKSTKIEVPGCIKEIRFLGTIGSNYNRKLEHVVIEEGVQEINSRACYACINLKRIDFPSSILQISSNLLVENNVSIVTFKNEPNYSSIRGCLNLDDFKAIKSFQTNVYDDGIFYTDNSDNYIKKTYKKYLTLAEGVYTFDVAKFREEINRTKNKTREYKKIERERFPKEFVNQGNSLLYYRGNSDLLFIPEGFTDISITLFRDCPVKKKIKTIYLPNTLLEIDSYVFKDCIGLKSIGFNQGLKVIKYGAFENCRGLTKVELPDSVKELGYKLFFNCSKLDSVKLPKNLEIIEESMFSGCSSLSKVVLPTSLKKIKKLAFYNCSSLNIDLPETLSCIEEQAFSHSALTSIIIPSKIKTIFKETFSCCQNLKMVRLPEEMEQIEEQAFSNCQSLTTINLPANLKKISKQLFYNCSSLEVITIPQMVEEIEEEAFKDCVKLKRIVIPEGITVIKKNTFKGCKNLQEVVLPESLITIEDGAFENCSSLSFISLPNNLKNIGDNVFVGCDSLKFILFPKSVDSIKENTFGQRKAGLGKKLKVIFVCKEKSSLKFPKGVWIKKYKEEKYIALKAKLEKKR